MLVLFSLQCFCAVKITQSTAAGVNGLLMFPQVPYILMLAGCKFLS